MNYRILIVNDNADICRNMQETLRASGFETCCAVSSTEGEKIAEKIKPQVALLALKLPDGLGTELLARIRKLYPDCLCIMTTDFDGIDCAVAAMEQGAFHYLCGPVRPKELLQLLHRAFEVINLREQNRQAVEALRTSDEKYRSLVENINVGIYRSSTDMRGHFLQANPAMAKVFGFDSLEEFLGVSIESLYLAAEERAHLLSDILQKGSVRERELRCLTKDGTHIWVTCSAKLQLDENGRALWVDGILEDITERKKLEEQFRHAQKMEAVCTLAGGIAHDFNNILTAIVGYANIMEMKMVQDDPLAGYLKSIITSADNAARLTRDLLAFSRKQLFALQPVSINQTVKRMESILPRLIGEGIELKTVLSEDDLMVMGDGAQLEKVITNIAANAGTAMPEGGTFLIEADKVELDSEFVNGFGYGTPGSYVRLSFTDTGIGMDEKTTERIFEPFFTTKAVRTGAGLGLSIAYGIVKQHNGYIKAHSESGMGTTIRIYLPVFDMAGESQKPYGQLHSDVEYGAGSCSNAVASP